MNLRIMACLHTVIISRMSSSHFLMRQYFKTVSQQFSLIEKVFRFKVLRKVSHYFVMSNQNVLRHKVIIWGKFHLFAILCQYLERKPLFWLKVSIC